MNEVFAYSVLGRHPHIVHYFSSWVEDDRVYIQTEYCNGGSLSSVLAECRSDGRRHLSETELKQLTVHISTGLKYIHSHALVHLDIKPGKSCILAEHGVVKLLVLQGAVIIMKTDCRYLHPVVPDCYLHVLICMTVYDIRQQPYRTVLISMAVTD